VSTCRCQCTCIRSKPGRAVRLRWMENGRGNAAVSVPVSELPSNIEIISHCVWLYHRFPLSFCEVEEMMLERGVVVSHETVRRWCGKFGQQLVNGLRRRRTVPGTSGISTRCHQDRWEELLPVAGGGPAWSGRAEQTGRLPTPCISTSISKRSTFKVWQRHGDPGFTPARRAMPWSTSDFRPGSPRGPRSERPTAATRYA
jgi:hypothetical protein